LFDIPKWGIFGGMENAKNNLKTIKVKDYLQVLSEFKRNCDREGTNMTAQIRRMIRDFNQKGRY
jgi:hypothetical protein